MEISKEALGRLPQSMTTAKRWMTFKVLADGRKLPVSPVTGGPGSSTNPDHWTTLTEALKSLRGANGIKVGLAFALGDGFCGLDLDHVMERDEIINDEADDIMYHVGQHGYAERSISGDGIHVIFECNKPKGYICKRSIGDNAELEMYGHGRYFTVSLDNEIFGERDYFEPQGRIVNWICDNYLKSGPAPEQKTAIKRIRSTPEAVHNYVNSVIRNTNWGEGNRNHAIFKAAGCIANKVGHDEAEVLRIMRGINAQHVTPPVEDEELRKTVRSALVNGTMPTENEFTPAPSKPFVVDEDMAEEIRAEDMLGAFSRGMSLMSLYNHLFENEAGFLGTYLRYAYTKTPDPMMNLSGALSCLATLLSGKVKSVAPKHETHPNLMICCLAPSGAGKESAININQKLMKEINQHPKIGPDMISSGEGIASAVREMGKGGCFFLDEFADRLGDSSQKRSSFVDSIILNLKTSYTKSAKTWKPNARSDSKLNFEIDKSLVNYYMTSTPDSWWQSFRREATGDGLLGRMMLFSTTYQPVNDLEEELELAMKEFDDFSAGKDISNGIPEELMAHARQWAGQTQAEQILSAAGITASEDTDTAVVYRYEKEAYMLQARFELECNKNAYEKNDGATPLWKRSTEKAARIALLLAASEHGAAGDKLIKEHHMRLAIQFVKAEIRNTYHSIVNEMADSDQERIKKQLLKGLVRKDNAQGRYIGSFNHKGIKWVNDHAHKNALEALVQEQKVYAFEGHHGKTKYYHFRYKDNHKEQTNE